MVKIISFQLALILLATTGVCIYMGSDFFVPALFGGLVALLNTWMMARHMRRSGEIARNDPKMSVVSMSIGIVQRFVLVAIALGVAVIWLFDRQAVPALLAVFIAAQMAYFLSGGHASLHQQNQSK